MDKYGVYLEREYRIVRCFRTEEDIAHIKYTPRGDLTWIYTICLKSRKGIINVGDIELISTDRDDLKRGFEVYADDEDGFWCIKVVPRSQITKAYKKEVYAIYNGDIECNITEPYKTGKYFLETFEWANPLTEKGKLIAERMYSNGFEKARDMGYGTYSFGKRVSPDDPKLKIIEKRTEIDINTL